MSVTTALPLAFVLSLLLVPVALRVLQHLGRIDHPGERSSHTHPTVRGAGVVPWAVALAVTVAVPYIGGSARAALLVAAGGFGLLGFVEDLRGIAPLARLLAQSVIALAAAALLTTGVEQAPLPALLATALGLLWLLAYVNAFNFMDGINGISVAQVLTASAGIAALAARADVPDVAWAAGVGAAVALGFAPYNFPNARGFLGDVGSYFFGAWLAVLVATLVVQGVPVAAALATVAIYLADTGATLLRRVRQGETWYLPHRSHTYQRLVQLGWSHSAVTGVAAAAMTVCSVAGVLLATTSGAALLAPSLLIVAALGAYLAAPTLLERSHAQGRVIT